MKARTRHSPLLVASATTLVLLGAGAARAAEPPRLVPAPVEKVFVPNGFDDNDNVEVVVHGHFPNTCWKTGPASATVDEATRTVTVDAKAYTYDQAAECAMVIVPFSVPVALGTVKQGTYEVIVTGSDATGTLVVGEATTSNPDDYLYLPVEQVALSESASSGQYEVEVQGVYPHMLIGCMVMKEIRAYRSPADTLVVMPIGELTDGDACLPQATNMKFSFKQQVGALPAEEILIHVRALNGYSLNRVTDLGR